MKTLILYSLIFSHFISFSRFLQNLKKHRRRPKRIIQRSKKEEKNAVLHELVHEKLELLVTSAKILRKRSANNVANREEFALDKRTLYSCTFACFDAKNDWMCVKYVLFIHSISNFFII